MKLVVCIPAYNEASVLEQTLQATTEVLEQLDIAEWVLVIADNNSTDATAHIVQSYQHERVEYFLATAQGKGAAVVACARSYECDIFAFLDADLSVDPSSLLISLGALQAGHDVVVGSRLLNTYTVHRGILRTCSSYFFNMVRKVLVGIRVRDSQCGMKMMNRKGWARLCMVKEVGWFFDIEFLKLCELHALSVYELPVPWNEYRYADRKSKLSVIKDGVEGIRAMVRIRKRLMVY
jgi:dolichyl-phosphate beta-glucosyltransferase